MVWLFFEGLVDLFFSMILFIFSFSFVYFCLFDYGV